jgi:hypothetical protein
MPSNQAIRVSAFSLGFPIDIRFIEELLHLRTIPQWSLPEKWFARWVGACKRRLIYSGWF